MTKRFKLGKSLGALFRKLRKGLKYKRGKSIGAPFTVLERVIHKIGGAPQQEIQVFYIPFNLEIPVAKLGVMSKQREKAIYMKSVMDFLEMLEACDD